MNKSQHNGKTIIFLFLFILIVSIPISLNGGMSYDVGSGIYSGTVLDNSTGLRWTRCSMTSNKEIDNSENCTQAHAKYQFTDAIEACENLTYAGISTWRLPNIRELQSIVTNYQYKPVMINVHAFPNTEAGHYWSSTTYNDTQAGVNSDAREHAFTIDFQYGNVFVMNKTIIPPDGFAILNPIQPKENYVRCVAGPGK